MSAANPLAERQQAFMRAIQEEGAPLPAGWGNSQAAGLRIYRGNYRHALMGVLAHGFERTAAYVGAEAFHQVSINHAIAHPPSHWTIDSAANGFAETCAGFFRENPEVAELAWLEGAMLDLVGAPDCEPLDAARFAEASAGFGDAEWMELTLTMMPRAAALIVGHDLERLWRSIDGGGEIDLAPARLGCIAWREGDRPTFVMVEEQCALAFAAMGQGASYGDLVVQIAGEGADEAALGEAAMRAGSFLGQWLQHALVSAIGREASPGNGDGQEPND